MKVLLGRYEEIIQHASFQFFSSQQLHELCYYKNPACIQGSLCSVKLKQKQSQQGDLLTSRLAILQFNDGIPLSKLYYLNNQISN